MKTMLGILGTIMVVVMLVLPGMAGAATVNLEPTKKDTSLHSGLPDTNFGQEPFVWIGGLETRALIKFDVSSIPSGSIVTSATLWWAPKAINAALNVEVYNVLKDWNENEATANQAKNGSPWEVFMGDIDSVVEDAWLINAYQLYPFDLTGLTQEWVNGVTANNGVMLLANPTSAVSPSEYWVYYGHPAFIVEYLPYGTFEYVLYRLEALEDDFDSHVHDKGSGGRTTSGPIVPVVP